MKKTFSLCVAFVFVTLFAAGASAQPAPTPTPPAPKPKAEEPKKEETSSLLAKWDVIISAPDKDYTGTLKLEKDGDAFKGSVTTELGESPLKNIKIKDDSFTADISVNAGGQPLEGTMSGKLKDGKLGGVIDLAGLGAIPYTGSKK